MSVTINLAGADAYFDVLNHPRSAQWSEFDEDQKKAAIAHAIRVLSRFLGSSIESETEVTSTYYYPSYAAYEQALFSLVNGQAIADGEQAGPHFLAQDPDEGGTGGVRKGNSPDAICAEAALYMQKARREFFLARG